MRGKNRAPRRDQTVELGILKTDETITVQLDRRAYSPVLRSADIPDTTVPWWGNRRLHLEYAEK